MFQTPSIIVIGSLNTDLLAIGIKKFPEIGEHVYGKELRIGPGGKSRNIAQMIATLAGTDIVAMLGKTIKDQYNLWKIPIDSLKKVGVNTSFIKVLTSNQSNKLPGIAFVPIDINGNNKIYVFPGITNDFSVKDIEESDLLFQSVSKASGFLVISLEQPFETTLYSIEKANKYNLKVILDTGGIEEKMDINKLLSNKLFFIKPNEHEIKFLTGITVNDFESAKKATNILLRNKIDNVLITVGKKGAYFFNKTTSCHIPIPQISEKEIKDETGCGDQTTATLCYFLWTGRDLLTSVKLSIISGTLQFHKLGIQPIKKEELDKYSLK